MRATFTNCHIRCNSQADVCGALAALTQCRVLVTPQRNGWVTVYSEKSDDQSQDFLRLISLGLSQKLKTAAFVFLVHKSQVMMYWFYQVGVLADEFSSNLDYFGGLPDNTRRARLRGNTEILLPLCVGGTTHAQVDSVIHPLAGPPPLAEEMLADLGKLLGIDETWISIDMLYFQHALPGIFSDFSKFQRVGKVPDNERQKVISTHMTEPDPVPWDSFVEAIGMMTASWSPDYKKSMKAGEAQLGADNPLRKRYPACFDNVVPNCLRASELPGVPTFEELKTARDHGPEALAKLIAQRTPGQLTEIAIDAVRVGSERFIAALLEEGLDPNATEVNGWSALSVAEEYGPNPKVYKLLKAASTRRH